MLYGKAFDLNEEQNLASVYNSVLRAMEDPEVPVKVQAALTLRELITSHSPGTSVEL